MARKARNPWDSTEATFPSAGTTAEKLRFIVGYAILAPSARNTQPWRFEVKDDTVNLYADFSRRLTVADPNMLQPITEDNEVVVKVLCTVAGASRASTLFRSIPLRHTQHGNYDGRPLTPSVIEKLNACATDPALRLLFVQKAPVKAAVAKLLLRADALALANPAYRQELAESIGSGNLGQSWLVSQLGQFALAHLDMEKSIKKRDQDALASSPAFGLISGEKATRTFQVKAGQLLQKLNLTAHKLGICMQPVSVLLETAEVNTAFTKLFRAGGVPLLPFRIGYADEPDHATPRRPLEEVLL
ncbi:MAG: hypothetical protein NT115_18225 [Proteobacteria bacterium]|nr:hypothetical protein [Pseudomonadota bacterium]